MKESFDTPTELDGRISAASQQENIFSAPDVLETALFDAIASRQFGLRYRPSVNLKTGKISVLESALHWDHPHLGNLAPRWFVPVAEQSELVHELAAWVLHSVCKDLRRWLDEGVTKARVSVNLSSRQFHADALIATIQGALSASAVEAHMLSIAISESTLMHDPALSQTMLRKLKELGVDLVLDDFGTACFPAHHLQRFPFDGITLGPSLMQDIVSSSNDAAILGALISTAHGHGMRVCAKRVETETQCEILRRAFCDEAQGALFSQPLPAGDIAALLQQCDVQAETLLSPPKRLRTLLLVDDEANILGALKRLLRRENYQILTAGGGQEGLALLKQHKVDVIVSDQRMPGMTGVEFFREAKVLYPETIRIVLSGYTELQSVTDAINEGAVYKFITKPWDDAQLCGHIAEAFQRKEMVDENERLNLEVRNANQELAIANLRLEEVLKQKQQQIIRDETSLDIVREALQHIPLPVIGLDVDNMIVFVNMSAQILFKRTALTLGDDANLLIPELFNVPVDALISSQVENSENIVNVDDKQYQVSARKMGSASQSRGVLLMFSKYEGNS